MNLISPLPKKKKQQKNKIWDFGSGKTLSVFYKTFSVFFMELTGSYQLPYDPAVSLLGIYLKVMKIYVHTIYTQMFIASLFI